MLSIKSDIQNNLIDCHGTWSGECVCSCLNDDGTTFLAWHDSSEDKTWVDVVRTLTAEYFGGFKIVKLWHLDEYRAQHPYNKSQTIVKGS